MVGKSGLTGPPGSNGLLGLQGTVGEPGQDAEYCPCPNRSNTNYKKKINSGYVQNKNIDNSDQYFQFKETLVTKVVSKPKPKRLKTVSETVFSVRSDNW